MTHNRFTVRRALLAAAFLLAPVGLVAGVVPAAPVGKFGIAVHGFLIDLFPHVPVGA